MTQQIVLKMKMFLSLKFIDNLCIMGKRLKGETSMKQEKIVYRFFQYVGEPIVARKELSFEDQLNAQLLLDEICFNWNKSYLEEELNRAMETNNYMNFEKYSETYKQYVWED